MIALLLLHLLLLLSPPRQLRLPLLLSPLYPLTKPIPKKIKMRPHNNRIFDQLLHTIHQPIPISTWQHPVPAQRLLVRVGFRARVGELCVSHGHGALVGDSEHAHPPPQDAERVDAVEGLRTAGDLGDGEGAALGWAHGAG